MGKTAVATDCLVKDSFELHSDTTGTLKDIKFVVKDCIAIAGHVSSFGHPTWRATHRASKVSAPIVDSMLAAGADMVGIAKLDQLAMSPIGDIGEGKPPLNFLYPDRFTGGSSSGSASAVSCGLADIAIGTDTSGSIRVPAASCGLYSIRPTHGMIAATGVLPLASSFDTPGLIAKDSTILRTTFNVLAKPEKGQPIQRILLPVDCLDLAATKISEAIRTAATRLGKLLEIRVEEVSFGPLIDTSANDLRGRLQCREIWQQHGEWADAYMHDLAPIVQTTLRQCKELYDSSRNEKLADLQARKSYRDAFNKLVRPGTVVFLPITPSLPPKHDATSGELATFRKGVFWLSAPAGLAGAPQVVLPVTNNNGGLTYGVGVLGAAGQDDTLVKLLSII